MSTSCDDARCGGAVTAPRWEVDSLCVDEQGLFPQLRGVCGAAGAPQIVGAVPTGTVTVSGSVAAVEVAARVSAFVEFPNACHGCRCQDLEDSLVSAGLDARCNPSCYGPCSCTIDADYTYSGTVELTASAPGGGDGGAGPAHCASGGALTLRLPGATARFREPEDLHTPEICDGVDNDGDGAVDEAVEDCPSCLAVGACATGVEAPCESGRWTCEYASPDRESVESRCDAVDNDCDGELTEGLDCVELCDGVDNDGIGGVDDSPIGAPNCTRVGLCAAGNAADCPGADGFRCTASQSGVVPAETTCDGVDDDCNGVVDDRRCAAGSSRMYCAYIDAARTGAFVARADVARTDVDVLVTLPLTTLLDVAVDPVGKKLYWANLAAGIQRANADGTGVETVGGGPGQPRLALDVARRTFYFSSDAGLFRDSLDAPGSPVAVPVGVSPLAMTVDSRRGWLYLSQGNVIYRSGLDGTGRIDSGEDLENVGQVIEGLAVEPVSGDLLGTSAGRLHRGRADLSGARRLVTRSYPHGLFLDPVERRLYWSETVTNDLYFMDLDATEPTPIPVDDLSVRMGDVLACPP
ncbi:MAG: hypothetical protein FJ104_14275 [Deltaproteobacteria bacterium]|nr:hypothetical protein [Deltaproteobacteria bacterium]